MTVPDPTAPTAEDVIAEAAHAAIFDYSETDAWPILGDDARAADFIAAAVAAAIRGMSVEQLHDLRPDLTVEHVGYDAHDGTGWHRRLRLVGPWRAEP